MELGSLIVSMSIFTLGVAGPLNSGSKQKYDPIYLEHHSSFTGSNVQKQFSNLYASPSIFITSRSQSAPDLIRAISPRRILVESDSHDVRLTTKLVWAATRWIAGCRGWKIEDGFHEWTLKDGEDEQVGSDGQVSLDGEGKEVWVARTLERNWARFLGLVD